MFFWESWYWKLDFGIWNLVILLNDWVLFLFLFFFLFTSFYKVSLIFDHLSPMGILILIILISLVSYIIFSFQPFTDPKCNIPLFSQSYLENKGAVWTLMSRCLFGWWCLTRLILKICCRFGGLTKFCYQTFVSHAIEVVLGSHRFVISCISQ